MDQCTENFECLVVNNNAKSNKLEDQVFWYKADIHTDFKVGSSSFWSHHKDHYKINNGQSDTSFNKNEVKKKKGPKINVKKYY
tara:strand:- start:54 stop:302 length:249 start_codon:yes stop_codon:yes gene_type:complete